MGLTLVMGPFCVLGRGLHGRVGAGGATVPGQWDCLPYGGACRHGYRPLSSHLSVMGSLPQRIRLVGEGPAHSPRGREHGQREGVRGGVFCRASKSSTSPPILPGGQTHHTG